MAELLAISTTHCDVERDGKVLTDAATVNPGDALQARLASGRLQVIVDSTESGD